ncbi:class II glutamine amidotransferase [Rudaeicoccus suwonensis]|uniref:Glutamine amidotransferase n=1 Tax=Rudaeicoccus suwonensis TaxID=657409 RepID=A0A561E131_9MICO|nr:class II glutamine amidotransferase [Rudaeicoccus suwonensis]TWE09313.1 glutamine amidotransferase [Rudaeicoccus suwonensis]
MCRLFGLHAGRRRAHATFWLLDAPDSLDAQSHRNPDGTGIGTFDADGRPHVDKQPLAAFEDAEFATEAKELESTTFVAHVRIATTGRHTDANTHPFEMDRRIFAHNGAIGGLDVLEKELGDDLARVHGDTDSERIFALITRETQRADSDVRAGLASAFEWLATNVPVFAVNIVLTTPTQLYAVRYPDTHTLYVSDRRQAAEPALDHRSSTSRVHSTDLGKTASVVIASEPLDDGDWQLLGSGELVVVDQDLSIDRSVLIDHLPAHRLTPDQVKHS